MEQVKGIEPSCSAWEADILPLNYTCGFSALLYYTTPRSGLQGKILTERKVFRPASFRNQ